MKHLKTYKIFESHNVYDIEKTRRHIQDICLPLFDEGFDISVSTIGLTEIDVTICVRGGKYTGVNPDFYFEEVSDEVNHITSYMHEEGYDIKLIDYFSGLYRKSITNTSLGKLQGEKIRSMITISYEHKNTK